MGLGCHALNRFSDHDKPSMADARVGEQLQILLPVLLSGSLDLPRGGGLQGRISRGSAVLR